MKPKLTSIFLACAVVAAGPILAPAQEARPSQETVKPGEPLSLPDAARKPEGNGKRNDGGHPDGAGKREGERAKHADHNRGDKRDHPKPAPSKPVTYLGLMTQPLSPEVAAQAGLPEGFGLLVADVMDGSPAKEAGFQKYDVLVMLGDQRIVNILQFQALIRSQKKGDAAALTIRRKGADVKVTATLGEHSFPASSGREHHKMQPPMSQRGGPGPRPMGHPPLPSKERMGEIREHIEQMRGMMRERLQNRGDDKRGPGSLPSRPGVGPMNHEGERKGPPAPPPGGPPSMKRDGDGGHPGRPDHGAHAKQDDRRDGDRPESGPRDHGPRKDGQIHRGADRAQGNPGNPAPRDGVPQGNGPRPQSDSHRDAARPDGAHEDNGPRREAAPGKGPRPEGAPSAAPRPDAPRGEGQPPRA